MDLNSMGATGPGQSTVALVWSNWSSFGVKSKTHSLVSATKSPLNL